MRAKGLCHGTAKLLPSAPSLTNVTAASSAACVCMTLRTERRVVVSAQAASSTSTAHGQPLLGTTVSGHLLSQGSDPSQIPAGVHGLSTGLSGASQGGCQVQREGTMPVTQASQIHFFPQEGVGRMRSFCRSSSLATPVFPWYHVLYWANINSARDIVIS